MLISVLITHFIHTSPSLHLTGETGSAGQRARSETKGERERCAVNMQDQDSATERGRERGENDVREAEREVEETGYYSL